MKSDSLGELAKWRSHAEIRDEISSLSNSSPLRLAASLSVLFRGALLSPSYVADPAWTESIVLSDAGNTLLHAFGLNKESDQATIKLALFKKFFHHHCLINCDASDLAEAQRVLDEELRGGKLFLALRWGRTLYDRYNDTFCEVAREEHLQSHAVLDLLAGTPIGVYQAGDIITGPLGLLQAQEARYIPPSRVLHLWHCSDIGCEAVHNVELLQPETALGRREKELSQLFSEMLGPASAWKTPLRRLIFPILRREPYTYFDIPLIIAETVFGAERQTF